MKKITLSEEEIKRRIYHNMNHLTFIGRDPNSRKIHLKCKNHGTKGKLGTDQIIKKQDFCKECITEKRSKPRVTIQEYQNRIDQKFFGTNKAGNYKVLKNDIVNNGNRYLKIHCIEHDTNFISKASNINVTKNLSCKKCNSEHITNAKLTDSSIIKKLILDKFGHKYEFLKRHKCEKTNLQKVKYVCNNHGVVCEQFFNNLQEGITSCKQCNKEKKQRGTHLNKKSYSEFVTKAKEIHGKKFKYLKEVNQSNNYENVHTIFNVECTSCGRLFGTSYANHVTKKHGCNLCSNERKGEVKIKDNLTKLGVSFNQEFYIKETAQRFDFYIDEFNLAIEFDGKQHFLPVEKFGGKDEFHNTVLRDKKKNDYTITNSINLIRIGYDKYDEIDKILKQYINKLKTKEIGIIKIGEHYSLDKKT